jgi:hypothetical protein
MQEEQEIAVTAPSTPAPTQGNPGGTGQHVAILQGGGGGGGAGGAGGTADGPGGSMVEMEVRCRTCTPNVLVIHQQSVSCCWWWRWSSMICSKQMLGQVLAGGGWWRWIAHSWRTATYSTGGGGGGGWTGVTWRKRWFRYRSRPLSNRRTHSNRKGNWWCYQFLLVVRPFIPLRVLVTFTVHPHYPVLICRVCCCCWWCWWCCINWRRWRCWWLS